ANDTTSGVTAFLCFPCFKLGRTACRAECPNLLRAHPSAQAEITPREGAAQAATLAAPVAGSRAVNKDILEFYVRSCDGPGINGKSSGAPTGSGRPGHRAHDADRFAARRRS